MLTAPPQSRWDNQKKSPGMAKRPLNNKLPPGENHSFIFLQFQVRASFSQSEATVSLCFHPAGLPQRVGVGALCPRQAPTPRRPGLCKDIPQGRLITEAEHTQATWGPTPQHPSIAGNRSPGKWMQLPPLVISLQVTRRKREVPWNSVGLGKVWEGKQVGTPASPLLLWKT